MMGHLIKVDEVSGHRATGFCNDIEEAWFALNMRWPERRPEGKEMDDMFQGLCKKLQAIQQRKLAPEELLTQLEAQLVSSCLAHFS